VGVSHLVDTHVLLWLLGEPDRIPDEILRELGNTRNRLLVSAASAMEVGTKVRLGKLEPARHLVDSWSARIRDIGGEELPITALHALSAGSMVWDQRDPFDRILVAQAAGDNLTLVTTDTAMRGLQGVKLRSW
jgi:PIN domain nuclease of toxin-antitoxin system